MSGLVARVAIAALVALAGIAAVALAASGGNRGSGPPASGSATDGWRSLAPSPLRRTEVGGGRIGRHVYVVGGFVPAGGATGRMLRYDIERDRWRRVRSLPIAVHHPGVTAHRGRLYVHGGLRTDGSHSDPTARLYRYNPERNRWRRLRDGRVPRIAHGFEALGGRLYAAGGNNDDGDLRSVEVYDPRRDRWRRVPRMPTARHHVGAAVLDRKLYVVAGRAEGRNIDTLERFDPAAGERGRWRELEPIGVERSGFAAVPARGTIVAFGGEELGGGNTIGEVERYDPATDSWSRLPSMRTPRHGLAGVVRQGRLYAIEGGPRPGLAYSAANEFLDLP
jgi:N-acetylneuraminic acid mutarotase